MKLDMLVTSDNIHKVVDIDSLKTSEIEFIEDYGVTAFQHSDENHVIFILGDIYLCPDCEFTHYEIHLVCLFGQTLEFTFTCNEIECHGSTLIYNHKDSSAFLWSGGSFAYDPVDQKLEIWAL